MQPTSSIKLPAKLEHLEQFMNFVSNCAHEHGIEQKRIIEMEISAEEAIVNIFNYAYQEGEGDVEVACWSDENDRLIIEIRDSGVPFDVLSLKEPDTTSGISDREVGGLGIFLMKNLMDEVRYKRRGEENVLTLVMSKSHVK